MALSLFSHILHPHPDVKHKINLSEPLAGALLVSPWTKFTTDDDSVKRNEYSDFVTAGAADRWSSLFMGTLTNPHNIHHNRPDVLTPFSGSAQRDNYNQAYFADESWFKSLDGVVKDVLVWGGGGEVLIDSIDATTKKLQKAHPRVEYVVQPNAAHEEFMMERMLGYKGKAEGTEVVERWMKARL
jgi:acetyl esterase/lipase